MPAQDRSRPDDRIEGWKAMQAEFGPYAPRTVADYIQSEIDRLSADPGLADGSGRPRRG